MLWVLSILNFDFIDLHLLDKSENQVKFFGLENRPIRPCYEILLTFPHIVPKVNLRLANLPFIKLILFRLPLNQS